MEDSTTRALEESILGGCMHYPKYVENLVCTPYDFQDSRRGQIFELIKDRAKNKRPVDPVALQHEITEVKGIGFTDLFRFFEEGSNSSVTLEFQAEQLVQLSRKRALVSLSTAINDTVDNVPASHLDTALESLRGELDEIASRSVKTDNKSFKEMLEESYETAQKAQDENVIPTGWGELDDYFNGGLRPGQLTIIAARPGQGKTVAGACMAVANHTQGVGFFSLEMPYQEITNRMASAETGIKLSNITQRRLENDDHSKFRKYIDSADSWKLSVEDKPQVTISYMRSTIKAWKREHDVKLVIVDYLQLVAPADARESRERQVSRISEDLKAMAKDLDIAVVALAQVNRGSANREDKRPVMSDLRESGGIEANADAIVLLHRDTQATDLDLMSQIEFIVAKNRHGRTGTIELVWRPEFSSINSAGSDVASYRFGMAK